MSDRPIDALPTAAARRVANQIARAFRGTFGAQAGLRTVVQSVTHQMLRAGWSRDAVARSFERSVLSHPGCPPSDAPNAPSAQLQGDVLIKLTAAVVRETAIRIERAKVPVVKGA